MTCEHLELLEKELIAAGIAETFRGQAWSSNCREWVYFDCLLSLSSIRQRLHLDPCVEDHSNDDPRSGLEKGLVCRVHHDGVIGLYESARGKKTFT